MRVFLKKNPFFAAVRFDACITRVQRGRVRPECTRPCAMARRESFAFENVFCFEGKKPSFFKSNICLSSSRVRLVRRFRMSHRCFGECVNCTAAQQCVFYLLSDIIGATLGGQLMTDYSVFESNHVRCTTRRRYYLDKKSCFLASRERREDDARGIDWRGFLVPCYSTWKLQYYRILAQRARTRRRGISDGRRVTITLLGAAASHGAAV